MGCCDNDKGCQNQHKKKLKLPWFAISMMALVVLVIYYWQ